MTLTLQQVKDAGLPATVDTIGKHGGAYVVTYLPSNPRKERFRVKGGHPYHNTTFGPGGEHTPQDGWQHEGGCNCQFCAATP